MARVKHRSSNIIRGVSMVGNTATDERIYEYSFATAANKWQVGGRVLWRHWASFRNLDISDANGCRYDSSNKRPVCVCRGGPRRFLLRRREWWYYDRRLVELYCWSRSEILLIQKNIRNRLNSPHLH
jgi:hypothetical protein